LLALGCSRAVTPPLTVSAARELGPVRTLVVVPASAAPTITGDGAAQAPAAISRMLLDAAARETQWTLASAERVDPANLAGESPEERAGEMAARLGADAAVTATIARYRERVGSAFGVAEPASVSFQVLLVRAGQKHAVWRADFTQTQEPLTYNLWGFWKVQRGGLRWLTADDLARIGVDEAVKRLAAATR
jgi:hypothetical protein